jgi:regulator of sirC expression with transglutaminase-like and TPR domain
MTDDNREELLALLERVGHQDDGEIDLADTALLLGALDAPDTDLAPYRRHLEQVAADIAALAPDPADVNKRRDALRTVLYGTHGYSGDQDTYDDQKNANLLHVIDRRKGLPVALGILCIHGADAVGWPLVGLNFPGHFLLRLEAGAERLVIDPFDECRSLEAAAIRSRLKEILGEAAEFQSDYFEPVSKRAILLRLQNNIKLRALKNEDPDRALRVLDGMALVAPHEEALFNERAVLYARRGELNSAIQTLSRFLDSNPPAEDHRSMEALLKNLRASLN